MAHQVHWTKDVYNNFIEMAMLSPKEVKVLEMRVRNCTITETAIALNCSESSIHRMVNLLKKKYDVVQKEHPEMFPKRRVSDQEKYMDTH